MTRIETKKSCHQPKPAEGMLKGIGAAAEIEESLPLSWACRFPIGRYEPYASSREAEPIGPCAQGMKPRRVRVIMRQDDRFAYPPVRNLSQELVAEP